MVWVGLAVGACIISLDGGDDEFGQPSITRRTALDFSDDVHHRIDDQRRQYQASGIDIRMADHIQCVSCPLDSFRQKLSNYFVFFPAGIQ